MFALGPFPGAFYGTNDQSSCIHLNSLGLQYSHAYF